MECFLILILCSLCVVVVVVVVVSVSFDVSAVCLMIVQYGQDVEEGRVLDFFCNLYDKRERKKKMIFLLSDGATFSLSCYFSSTSCFVFEQNCCQ